MDDFESEIKRDFLQEAKDLLESTEQSFLELEKSPSDKVLIDTIFRFAHNLKGSSRAVGFGQIAELTHKAENLLLEIKQEKLMATDKVVSTLLLFNDKVKEMIEGLSSDLDAQFSYDELISDFDAISSGTTAAPHEVKAEEVKAEESVEETPASEEQWEQEVVEASHTVVAEVQTAPAQAQVPVPQKETKKEARKDDETLRVSLSRLEKLNDLVGELVILQTVVESCLSRVGENKTSRSLGKLCKDIQDLSMSLRMVAVGTTFQKLTRVVRDTSKLLGKKVDLQLAGEETEIDKTVVESLGDPLVHIIRNAIDHGVEVPEERIAAGKPEEGIVEVMAFHEGNFLIIQITDDGKGINGEKLIEKAKAKGIISQNASLSVQQGVELIFHPGFSSKDEVSEVSGRGVGMDVVKTNIEALGGEVKVRSKVGSGSCFRLMLPLTLAIIDAMLIESGGQTLVVPKAQVHEVIKLDKDQITQVTGRRPYITLREQVIPLFFLEEDMGSVCKEQLPLIAMIIRQNDQLFAVGIHDILRQQQVVVKPPTKEMMGRAGIMGTTILGDGKPSIIVDIINLYAKRLKKRDNLNTEQAA